VILAMPLALFHQALSGRFVVAGYDLILYAYPYRAAAAAALARGRFPFWNPDIYAGVPFFANIQSAVLYPVNWLFSWPGGPQMLTWSIIINLAIGGVLFYGFCRRALQVSPAPALIGALAFGFSGFAIAQSEHLNQNGAIPWIPGVLLAVDQAYRTRRPLWAGVLGIVLALEIFAGAPQEVYYTVLLALGWLALLLLRHRGAGLRRAALDLRWPLLGLAAGLLLAMVQLLPTLELTRYSVRSGGLPVDEALAFSLPVRGVLGNLLADYGAPLYTEWAGYVGLLATLLVALAIARRWRDPLAVALAALAALCVLVALGHATPLFSIAYHLLPGFSSFRVPARLLLLSTFALAALAALGAAELDRLLADRRWRAAWPLLLGPLLLLLYAVAFALQRRGVGWRALKIFPDPILSRQLIGWLALLVGVAVILLLANTRRFPASTLLAPVVALELFMAAQPLNPLHVLPAQVYAPDPVLAAELPSDTSPYRSLSLARPSNASLADTAYRGYDTRRAIDQPDLAMETGRATLDGYDGGILPLASYVRFRAILLPPGAGNPPDFPLISLTDSAPPPALLHMLGVRDLVVNQGASAGVPSGYQDLPGAGLFTVREDPTVLSRAFLLHDVQSASSSQQAVALAGAASFTPDQSAIVTGGGCAASLASAPDRVDLVRNDPERVEVRSASDAAGVLVISSTNYPGWRATVDGLPVAVREVDGLLQGVCLPAGRHAIVLTFLPDGWGLALGLSVLGVALTLGLGAAGLLGRRRHLGLQGLDHRP
jgi:hypothetical protein